VFHILPSRLTLVITRYALAANEFIGRIIVKHYNKVLILVTRSLKFLDERPHHKVVPPFCPFHWDQVNLALQPSGVA